MVSDEKKKEIYENFATVIRDAQVSAFEFAKKSPLEKKWMVSVLRNLATSVQILEYYMINIFDIEQQQMEKKDGEN